MDKINKYPPYRVTLFVLIGGTIGALLSYISYNYVHNIPIKHLYYFPPDFFGCFLGTGLGAILGLVSGTIVYAIKPRLWASMMGAALGGAVVPMMVWASVGVSYLNQYKTVNRLKQTYQEYQPFPTLIANFQELARGSYIESCAVSSDGSRLVLGSNGQIVLWDLNQNKPISKFPFDYEFRILALSQDGLKLAHGYWEGVTLWDVKTGKELAQLEGNAVDSLVFSPDSRLLAWTEERQDWQGEQIILWEPLVEEEVTRIDVPNTCLSSSCGQLRSLAFSPDSKLIVSGKSDGQITFWDTATLKPVGELQTGTSLESLSFSPDGSLLAVGISLWDLEKAGIELWDVATRMRLVSTQSPTGSSNVAFSPDGLKLITSGDPGEEWEETIVPGGFVVGHSKLLGAYLYIWDTFRLESIGWLPGPTADTSEAFILPNGRVLACYWNNTSITPDSIGIWTIDSP